MRFALATGQGTAWETLCGLCEAADDVDLWESAWTGDHFYPFLEDPSGPCLEGWVTLAALAQRTRRLRLGVLVSGMPHRHPAVLAKMAAALDITCGGRLELGLGAAWYQMECDAYGIELGSLRTRMDRFEEGVEVITSLLTKSSTTFSGRHYQLHDARCEPKPLQSPHPPIVIGGTGERRTARVVARWADHWNLGFTRPESFPVKLGALAKHCAELGRDPADITTSVVVRTADGAGRRDMGEVVDEIRAYEDAGCQVVFVEAVADHPDEANVEIDRLSSACERVAR
ncbi:MAG: luciferase [Acidimicrobiales bacterium]|nr:luciferase [Acidimicrobiales bacterium]